MKLFSPGKIGSLSLKNRISFAPMGVSLEQSTLLSLLSFSLFVIVGLLGGLFYLFGSHSYKKAEYV